MMTDDKKLELIQGDGGNPLHYHDTLESASEMLLECLNKIEDLGVTFDFERMNGRNIFALLMELPEVNGRRQVLKIQVPLSSDDQPPSAA
jgi:hypothetical protein